MAKLTTEQKRTLVNLIEQDELSAKQMADEINAGYSTVLSFRSEYKEAKVNGELKKVLNMPETVIQELAENIDYLPKDEVKRVVEEVNGLKKLEGALQTTALEANKKLMRAIQQSTEVSELSILVEILSTLQNSFFNKNIVQVAVQNNFGEHNDDGQNRYSNYLDSTPTLPSENN